MLCRFELPVVEQTILYGIRRGVEEGAIPLPDLRIRLQFPQQTPRDLILIVDVESGPFRGKSSSKPSEVILFELLPIDVVPVLVPRHDETTQQRRQQSASSIRSDSIHVSEHGLGTILPSILPVIAFPTEQDVLPDLTNGLSIGGRGDGAASVGMQCIEDHRVLIGR